jgi:hypothetical protein
VIRYCFIIWMLTVFSAQVATAITADGALSNITVTPTSPGTVSGEAVGGIAVAPTVGNGFQRIVSDVNFQTYNWLPTGKVNLDKSITGGDETVRLVISGQQITATFIPEPTSSALLLVSGLALGLRRRRNS